MARECHLSRYINLEILTDGGKRRYNPTITDTGALMRPRADLVGSICNTRRAVEKCECGQSVILNGSLATQIWDKQ